MPPLSIQKNLLPFKIFKSVLDNAYQAAILYILYIYAMFDIYGERGGRVDIIISNASQRPIYEQITSQIKNMIVSGALSEGDALPSMRPARQGAAHQRDHNQACL